VVVAYEASLKQARFRERIQRRGEMLTFTRPANIGGTVKTWSEMAIVEPLSAKGAALFQLEGMLNIGESQPFLLILAGDSQVSEGDLCTIVGDTFEVLQGNPARDQGLTVVLYVVATRLKEGGLPAPAPPPLLLPAPTAFWRLEEATGQRADSVGGMNLNSGGGTGVVGHIGNACQFSAVSGDVLYRANAPALSFSLGSWTVALWFQLTSNTSQMVMMFKGGLNPEMYLQYDPAAPGLAVIIGGAPTNVTVDWAGVIAPGSWHLAVASFDSVARTLSIQLDNQTPEIEPAPTTINATTGTFCLGSYALNSSYFDGLLDAVGKWDRVLTAGECTKLWNSGAGREFVNGAWV
jgi:hypothetical protein